MKTPTRLEVKASTSGIWLVFTNVNMPGPMDGLVVRI